jgi:hypothetical protein
MLDRTPVAAEGRPPVPEFDPVPVRYRHDGWTPERQRGFIEALAETGSVTSAARRVNMSLEGCYYLRRHPGAESFRRAWEAALDFGVLRLRDLAFERAITGELVPVFKGERLLGYRRKHNNALLMFCLRHYGISAGGKRTTINYFSTRAEAGSANGERGAAAQASATTVRTVVTEPRGGAVGGGQGAGASATLIEGFDGVTLDAAARAEIEAAFHACAARQRAADALVDEPDQVERIAGELADPDTPFVRLPDRAMAYHDDFVAVPEDAWEVEDEGAEAARGDEVPWHMAGAEVPKEYLPYVTAGNSTIGAEEVLRLSATNRTGRTPPARARHVGFEPTTPRSTRQIRPEPAACRPPRPRPPRHASSQAHARRSDRATSPDHAQDAEGP